MKGGRFRHISRILFVGACLLVAGAYSASAVSASRNAYKTFQNCPVDERAVTNCIHALSSGGSVTIGTRSLELTSPIVLQGGFAGSGQQVEFFGASDGNTLSKSRQPISGGLTDVRPPSWWPEWLRKWFTEEVHQGAGDVTATLELAGPASSVALSTENLISHQGTALGLPAKIHLENPLLGPNCHLGSDEQPIPIDFTTGKSGDFTGASNKIQFSSSSQIFTISDARLVNGSFPVPGAEGCGGVLSFFLNPLVNELLGAPSDAGRNSAVLEGTLHGIAAQVVRGGQE
jgi:hypothetical protein